MNIIFLGSSKFAVPAFYRILASSHYICCVVTQPDRLKGRGLVLSCTDIKKAAGAHKIRIYQPADINRQESVEFLKSLNPDLLVVVAFGQLLSSSILNIPKIMAINLHASLLPKYRGAAPVNWALIKGEATTGVSIVKMSQKLDAGPIILQKKIDIQDSHNAATLTDILSNVGADLLLESLDLIQSNKHKLLMQNDSEATFAPKLKKEHGLINWDKSARDIFNLVRGCVNWPGAFTYYKGKVLKIHRVSLLKQTVVGREGFAICPGNVLQVSKQGIIVATGEGNLAIEELQIEGKKSTSAQAFVAGHKIAEADTLGEKN